MIYVYMCVCARSAYWLLHIYKESSFRYLTSQSLILFFKQLLLFNKDDIFISYQVSKPISDSGIQNICIRP